MVRIDRKAEVVVAFGSVILYTVLSLIYLASLDIGFYAKNILNCGIAFAFPAPYILLTAFLILTYASLLKCKIHAIAYPITAMAVILALFYLLIDLKIGMIDEHPFVKNRRIFETYGITYFVFFLSSFSVFCGYIFRRIIKKENPAPLGYDDSDIHRFILHLPILIFFLYGTAILLSRGLVSYAVYAYALFFLTLLFKKSTDILRGAKELLGKIVKNEKLFLMILFVSAFLLRYFWGMRLLELTGANFIMASDDGPCYDDFAATLAQGRLLPKESLYVVSGFGYWYFLAAIYKIFGPHNFKAMIAIQASIGSLIPIAVYLISGRIFKTRPVSIISGIVASLDMTLIFLSVTIAMEAIYIPLVIFAILAAVYVLTGGTIDHKKAFLVGSVFGLAYNARAPELAGAPFIMALIIFAFRRGPLRVKNLGGVFASLFMGFILFISIQYVTNYIVYAEPPRMQAAAAGSFALPPGSLVMENNMLGEMGFNPFLDLKRSIYVLINSPARVSELIIKGFFKRLIILYFQPNFGVVDPLILVNPGSGYFFRFPVWAQCSAHLFVAFGILTAYFRRKELPAIATLLAFLAYLSFRVAFFAVLNARYRGVLIPIFAVFFSYGIYAFYEKAKGSYKKENFSHAE